MEVSILLEYSSGATLWYFQHARFWQCQVLAITFCAAAMCWNSCVGAAPCTVHYVHSVLVQYYSYHSYVEAICVYISMLWYHSSNISILYLLFKTCSRNQYVFCTTLSLGKCNVLPLLQHLQLSMFVSVLFLDWLHFKFWSMFPESVYCPKKLIKVLRVILVDFEYIS